MIMVGINLLKASTDDANFLKSILGRGKDWTPFAIKQADRISNNFYRLVRGKQDVFDFATKLSGFGRSTIPGWDYAKITLTGEKIGEVYGETVIEVHHIDYFTKSHNNDSSNIIILSPNFHRIIHKNNPVFNWETLTFDFPNGYHQSLLLNKHLEVRS